MANPNDPEIQPTQETNESFQDILAEFEKSHSHKAEKGSTPQREGTVVSISDESVLLDIGYKTEGILPRKAFTTEETVAVGDKIAFSVKGRNPDGYYELSRMKVATPTDWSALEKAFAEKTPILGTVTAVIKGGLSVDVGVRAFMPASRSGERDAAKMEKLVGEQIRCRIIKLDTADEDVVVDRRSVIEEEERVVRERRWHEIVEGDTLSGTVRSLTDYGAFIDLGGIDGLLHVSDMSWGRVSKPSDVLTEGQQVEVKVLKVDQEKKKISLGLKQLQKHPWDAVPEKFKVGEKVSGTVARLTDFGAFVELEPGIEGLIHISEMSWSKKVRKAADLLKPGETVETVILGINPGERRISLGLKQALGDPWTDAARQFAAGTIVKGPVTNIMKFGAFVQLAEGVEGMVHVSEISAEKRIEHPQDALKVGQEVEVLVLALDLEKRQIKLSMKQLVPTGLDEYIAEHKVGDTVTGRLLEDTSSAHPRVELGEGILAICTGKSPAAAPTEAPAPSTGAADLSALSAMLKDKWKSGSVPEARPQQAKAGQIRSFRIVKLDAAAKKIEVELA
ncbi:MAG: 30S ribosomal protein S1 [Acidobacteriota bacterium]|nr:30S ribosomal protein S1 [Acidobacteriota bacterium]